VLKTATSPLAGKRIVITRAAEQADSLYRELQARHSVPILFPLIGFAPPDDFTPLDSALRDLSQFDWLFVTSQNVLRVLLERSAALSLSLSEAAKGLHIAAVGHSTANAAKDAGLSVSHVAANHYGLALAEELEAELLGCHVFLPRSDRANPDLPEALRRFGVEVTEVIAYRTVRPADPDPITLAQLSNGEADAVLFFSPSAVQHLKELLGEPQFRALQEKAIFAAIGPVTAGSLRGAGVERIVSASDTTASAVVGVLEEFFTSAKQLLAGVKRA
jgi:uroporphyrinogen III methyltransferase / synthase